MQEEFARADASQTAACAGRRLEDSMEERALACSQVMGAQEPGGEGFGFRMVLKMRDYYRTLPIL
jgi:hypothetical protein